MRALRRAAAVILASPWNSLEIAKLAIAILTPILLLGLGVLINTATRRVERAEWSNRKLIERRLDVYDAMAPLLNDLYCFFRLRGHFRDITPPDVVAIKRDLDKRFHVNRFLFEASFADRYESFIEACFLTFTGFGQPAKLRAVAARHEQERRASWQAEWQDFFAPPEDATPERVVELRYEELMEHFGRQVGVAEQLHT